VEIAASPTAFIGACERMLALDPEERGKLSRRMRAVVDGTSWEQTAAHMRELIDAVATRRGRATRALGSSAPSRTLESPVVVIGAGPTGLSAAYHLGEDALLIDQNATVGGWCRSIVDNGFTFDYAGHIMFSNDPYVHRMYEMLLGDNVHWQDREAWIYSKDVYTRYPFQGALYGLPPDVLKECIVGAIEARFGSLKTQGPGRASSAASSPTACKAESITDCCADGVVDSLPRAAAVARPLAGGDAPRNFEEFIYKVWGRGVAKHFAIPYNRKLWAVPLSEMETSWLGGRVPMPDLEEMIAGALQPVPPPMGPNARFGYPLRGGFQALMDGFLPHLRGDTRLGTRVVRVGTSRRELELDDGTTVRYEQLVSTMPLPVLVKMIGDEAPMAVREAAQGLRHVSVRCVNLGVGRTDVTDKHWIYYPEDSVFHRVFVQGNASPHCNAPGGFGLTCEITYSSYKPLPCDGDALIDRCIRDCIAVGLIREDDTILARNLVDMPHAYVVYDHARAGNVQVIRDWLLTQDIHLAGRYSEWEYYNSDHAFLAGRKVAQAVEAVRGDARRSFDAVTA
ncbi:MAG: UDP-galactopyranose mutase, partial [Proteobacteria bacterium]